MTGYAVAFVIGAVMFGTATGNKMARKVLTVAAVLAVLCLAAVGGLALYRGTF